MIGVYLEDAQQRLKEGKLKPGEDVRIVDGRVQGQRAGRRHGDQRPACENHPGE